MHPIKRRFYYDSTGFIFFELNLYGETTVGKDIQDFKALSERNRETFDVIELPYEAYAQDFAIATGYSVDVETKKLKFVYSDPNDPEAPPVHQKPLSEVVSILEMDNADLWYTNMQLDRKVATLEADNAEIWYTMMMGGMEHELV